MFLRPLSDVNSMTAMICSTMPPADLTSSHAAAKLPPVASRSSTISTRWSFWMLPSWISNTALPYSSVYW